MNELTLRHGRSGMATGHPPSAWNRLCALWRRCGARHVEGSRRRRELRALRVMSDATLRDLGLERSEIASIQAEIDGRTAATRMRVMQHERGC
jgi:uncharacterized protein YjiS (DUF1127 family)